jgi:thiol-disulfide isomerase/thioredoxin
MNDAYKRFEQLAIPVEQYIQSMENNRDAFVRNIETTMIDDDTREYFGNEPVTFFVLTEDWCVDSVQFIPVLVKLAREIPDVEVRVLRRDEHREFAENYRRSDGYQAIPVIIAFDQNNEELRALIERQRQATDALAAETRRFQEANPDLEGIRRNVDRMPEQTREAVKSHAREWRLSQQEAFTRYLLDELRDIIERGRKASAA